MGQHIRKDLPLRGKNWFVTVPGSDVAACLVAQAAFIRRFMSQVFDNLDAGRLPGAASANFNRLAQEVRFRIIGPPGAIAPLVPVVEDQLRAAQSAGLITSFRSEQENDWPGPDPNYGTDVPGVVAPFTSFLESVSRATVALLNSSSNMAVAEPVLKHWLHLVHNPMTGIERTLVELKPGSAVWKL